MRTTVRVDDDLMRRAKAFAAENGKTLTEIMEAALREKLARAEAARAASTGSGGKRRKLPTFSGSGLQPGVDLHDTASLLDLMDRADA